PPPISTPAVRPPPGLPGAAPIYGTAMAPPIGFQQAMAESVDDHTGARAIEVAAMMGDSVVGVKHCINPRSGHVTPATWASFVVGIATLVLAIVAFTISIQNAKYNKGQFEYETQTLKRPAYSVRPRTLSWGYDWMAFGGLLLSIGAFTFGIARF